MKHVTSTFKHSVHHSSLVFQAYPGFFSPLSNYRRRKREKISSVTNDAWLSSCVLMPLFTEIHILHRESNVEAKVCISTLNNSCVFCCLNRAPLSRLWLCCERPAVSGQSHSTLQPLKTYRTLLIIQYTTV